MNAESLERLGARFLERSIRDLQALRVNLQAVRDGDPDSMPRLVRIAHAIHGAGASFGFVGVSEAAGHIERRAREALAAREAPDSSFCDELDKLLAGLDRTLKEPCIPGLR